MAGGFRDRYHTEFIGYLRRLANGWYGRSSADRTLWKLEGRRSNRQHQHIALHDHRDSRFDPATQYQWTGIPTPTGGFPNSDGYGAEVVWTVDSLGFQSGHTYRVQIMVHDGDQNGSGGDVGEGCAVASY